MIRKKPVTIDLNSPKRVDLTLKQKPKKWISNLILALVVLGLIIYSFVASHIKLNVRDFKPALKVMINGFLNPNTKFLFGLDEASIPYLTMQTVAIAFIGTIVAAVLAIPLGFLTARNVTGKYVSKVGEVILVVIRTFPEVLLALVLIRVVGIGAFTGVLTIGIHSVGMIAKLFAESIENMDRGPLEALDTVGANTIQKIRYGIFPQITAEFLSISLYRFDINVRSATVLGVVSAGGLGTPLIFASQEWNWPTLSAILIAIVIMVIIVDQISSRLRAKLI